ncbi:MAG: 4-hydroxy-tetrahydrodipicolinate reductase [Bacteroidales bacterium]|nr:4-hydroxy-tetrahydrodipicolinate reductase [Bacteroidales bacterium]MCF8454757.1 4-hydroxy-tetrahydrodipicolinate reductase [Bacteroidales bacterium]
MKIAIIGYGNMGKELESLANERGHEIVAIIDKEGFSESSKENLKKAHVAIEFSTPETAFDNYLQCFDLGIPVVSGSTGWLARMDEVKEICVAKGAGFFYASNFSLGVNLFFEVNRKLARLISTFPNYQIAMEEIHHIHKKDAPSGTAISLANDIISENKNKTGWVCNTTAKENEIAIVARRIDNVPGIHTITYDSPVDCIEISHRAKNRKGFAMGAILAAEFMKGKKGIFGMKDLLEI